MTNRYEVLLALDTRGKEESAKEITERLEKDFVADGAKIEQVQRLERRDLAYEHAHMKQAYFVNFVFRSEPATLEKLRARFALDEEVALHQFIRLPETKTEEAA
jgi:small subunit ribosomal protein S6